MDPISSKENLKREIGVLALTMAMLNITVGTGIFVIPALVADGLGAAAILAYVLCGLVIFLIALCFAELGSQTTSSGGVYTYIENAFGPYAGFLANNLYWFGAGVFSDAAVANGLADTLKIYFPILGSEFPRILFFLLVFGGIAILNIRSLKNTVRAIEIITLGKLVPLMVVVVAGFAHVSSGNLEWHSTPNLQQISSVSLLLFFAFVGFEGPLSNGGEIKNARRTVPLAIFFGMSLVLGLYICIQMVTQGVLGNNLVQYKEAPLGAVAEISMGKWGGLLLIIATIIAMLGNLGGEIMSLPRILFAGARDGLLPKPLAKVHPRFFTPYIAILFYTFLDFIIAATGEFKQLAIIASAAVLIIYLGVVLASIKLRKNGTAAKEKTFRMPGGILIPVLASAGILWLLSNMTRPELTGLGLFTLVFSAIYIAILVDKRRKHKKGAVLK